MCVDVCVNVSLEMFYVNMVHNVVTMAFIV